MISGSSGPYSYLHLSTPQEHTYRVGLFPSHLHGVLPGGMSGAYTCIFCEHKGDRISRGYTVVGRARELLF